METTSTTEDLLQYETVKDETVIHFERTGSLAVSGEGERLTAL
jgi:hypothetical protein